MTADRNEKLKALALAATKGPWKLGSITLTTHKGCEGSWWELHSIMMAPEGKFAHWQAGFVRDQADAEFIAACREMVPELIAEVERLRAAKAGQLAIDRRALSNVVIALIEDGARSRSESFRDGISSGVIGLHHKILEMAGVQPGIAGAAKGGITIQCVGCEGSPSGDNNPCAVCGCSAPAAGTEKDAERYRWLRDSARSVDWSRQWTPNTWSSHCRTGADQMDKAIDAAIGSHAKAGQEPT